MTTQKRNWQSFLLGIGLTVAGAPSAWALPSAPSATVAFPSYGAAVEIVVRWHDEAVDEIDFEIERGIAGGWSPVATVPALAGTGLVEWRDSTISADTLYSYRVRARNGSGNSDWVQTPSDTQRPTNNFWPRTDGVHDIMNIWSGTAIYNGQKFHEGIDFHAIEPVAAPPPEVRAIRGGTIAATAFSGPGMTMAVEVSTGVGTTEYDYYLHLQDITAKGVGEQIAPGEFLGRISTTAYGVGRRHTHVMRMAANSLGGAGWSNCRSPWLNFAGAAERDPLGNNPHLLDQSGSPGAGAPDGRLIFAVDAAAPGTVVDPVRGDVDLLVEAYDDMNTTLTYEDSVGAFGYWVEPHVPGGTAIGSAAAPLRLFDFDDTWFADFSPIRDKFDDVFDETRTHPGTGSMRGHQIATSATTTSAQPADADGSKFWRTKARAGVGTAPYFGDAAVSRHNGEARFPDGRYTVHALLSDQVHHDVEETRDLILDNWLPSVTSVSVQGPGTLSQAGWVFNAGTGLMDISFPAGAIDIVQAGLPSNAITFTITFSEPMETATLNIPGVSWAAPAVTLTANANRTVWTGTLPAGSPPAGTDASGLYFLQIDGTDLAGNGLAGRGGFSSFDPVVAFDPVAGAAATDTAYRFAIATQRDIALVLDRSGSMGMTAPGFATKMDALKDAGNIFLDILTPSTGTDIAAVKYDNIIELLCGACGMGPATSAHIDELRAGIGGLSPRNMTSIGGALTEAANQLSGAGGEKNLVLLFTDGMHNTPPSVASGLASIHALVPDNTTISAIGFGEGTAIDVPELQGIVDSANGQLWTTGSGHELHKFFVEALMNAGGTPYTVFITDPIAEIANGEVKEHPFTISADDRQIAVIAEWGNNAGSMSVRLVAPDGVTTITPASAATNPRIRYSSSAGYGMYQLTFPLDVSGKGALAGAWQGTWRIVVDGKAKAAGTHKYAYSVISSSDLEVSARLVGGRYTGDKLYAIAKLTRKGIPVTGRLSAVIDAPMVSTANAIAAVDPPPFALSSARAQLSKRKLPDSPATPRGVYEFTVNERGKPLSIPRLQTSHRMTAVSANPGIKLGPGEYLLEVPDTTVAGDYRLTVVLNSVGAEQHSPRYVFLGRGIAPQFDGKSSEIHAIASTNIRFLDRKGPDTVAVELTPKDRFGNLLGAGLLERKALAAKVEGAKLRGIADQGNGRYALDLEVTDSRKAIRVRVDIDDSAKEFLVSADGRILEK